ncbi:MAG TPA: ABC transporter substrate-binding protein [Pseudobacteroides sp.]|uniref:ABC transporter substrate-binding protein n=1 Tax=Pseudobacteroides sp. TaxID=1968840 RepID=UPI002F923542
MRKTFLKLAMIIIAILFLLPSCSPKNNNIEPNDSRSSQVENKVVLGFSQVGAESDWRTANSESIQSAAQAQGIKLIFSNAQQKQENQIKAIRSFIAQKVDIIAFSPIVESGWEDVLNEAKIAGIPVIVMDRAIDIQDKTLYVTHIGSDFEEEGRKAGRWLLEKVKNIKGSFNVVELRGTFGSSPTNGRSKGFEEIIKPNTFIKMIGCKYGDFMKSKGKEIMENFLKSEGNRIHVVYSHNDDMALGAVEAIEEYGLKPGKDIIIISIDAVKAAFDAMIEGKINCTVECNPLQGPELMKAVKSIMNGTPLPKRIIINEGIFPQDVAKSELPNRKY